MEGYSDSAQRIVEMLLLHSGNQDHVPAAIVGLERKVNHVIATLHVKDGLLEK